MSKRKERNTKGKIVAAAWKLFYDLGYEETTVEEIIEESGTSRGSFYHYFPGKDALLATLSDLFDAKYEQLMQQLPPDMDSFETLMYLNRELFAMIEGSISMQLLSRLYSTQLITKGEKHLLDRNRIYFKLLTRIVSQGQQSGQLREDVSVNEIVKAYALCERALIYDWCMCGGEYSLKRYSADMMPRLFSSFKK